MRVQCYRFRQFNGLRPDRAAADAGCQIMFGFAGIGQCHAQRDFRLFIGRTDQIADIFTKPLSHEPFEKLRKMRRENEIQEGNTIPMDEVTAALRVATAKWDSVLTSKLDQEAPARLVGKDIAEIRAEMATIHDELRESMERELTFNPAVQ